MSEYMKAVLIRAGYTMAEAALAIIGTSAVMSDVNWKMVLSASVLAGIVSVLKSIATGVPEVQSADEMKDNGEKAVGYPEEEYDYLYIDEDVDEGDDDEVE